MPQKRFETPLGQARRHVAEAEAEARVARQHKVWRQVDADKHPDVAATMQQVLVTMETTLSAMQGHLWFEEQEGPRVPLRKPWEGRTDTQEENG